LKPGGTLTAVGPDKIGPSNLPNQSARNLY
jgi:pentatricopeptide repeat protein